MSGETMHGEKGARSESDRKYLEFFRRLVSDGELILGRLGFGIRIDRSIPTLAFDHTRRDVLINPDFIEKKKLTPNEQRYVFGHEIAHFVQLVSDSDTYLKTFEIAKRRSDDYKEKNTQQAVRQAWNKFFNVFLDVHDNAIVDARSLWTQSLPESDHPRQTLYQNLTSGDLKGSPKTEQFNFAILRKVMLGVESDVDVDDDVAAIINVPYRYGGKTFNSVAHFVKEHFFDPNLPLHVLLSKLNRTLIPLYESLVKDDIASGKIFAQTRTVELTGDGQDGDEIGKIVDAIKKSHESGSERAKRNANEAYEKGMSGEGFSKTEISTLQDIRENTRDVFQALVELWDAFIQRTVASDVIKETGFVSGEDVDIPAFVRELPRLFTEPDQARIMERSVNEPIRESEKPKTIHLCLILDLSGSMNDEKRRAVQEVAYSLTRSLIQFRQDKKNGMDDQFGDIFDINLRLIGFGSSSQDLFDREHVEISEQRISDNNPHELEARLARAVLRIKSVDLGATCDDDALQMALDDISRPETKRQFDQDDGVAVVIEITDGETTTATTSQQIVNGLNRQKNVYARAIKIPGLLQADQPVVDPTHDQSPIVDASAAFETVWGKHGKRLDALSELKRVMIDILFAALKER